MNRLCSKCGGPTKFALDYRSRQGYWCGPCRSKASVESAKKHRARKRRNNNDYHKRISSQRAHRTAAYRAAHPEQKAAHQAVQTAIRNGTLIRQMCRCGSTRTHAHHEDYSKPLEVVWLCHTHHMERHAMTKAITI